MLLAIPNPSLLIHIATKAQQKTRALLGAVVTILDNIEVVQFKITSKNWLRMLGCAEDKHGSCVFVEPAIVLARWEEYTMMSD